MTAGTNLTTFIKKNFFTPLKCLYAKFNINQDQSKTLKTVQKCKKCKRGIFFGIEMQFKEEYALTIDDDGCFHRLVDFFPGSDKSSHVHGWL